MNIKQELKNNLKSIIDEGEKARLLHTNINNMKNEGWWKVRSKKNEAEKKSS